MYTSTEGLGFALGGTSSVWTQAGTGDDYEEFVDSMVVYNSTSEEWYNVTAVQDGGSQTWGAAHFVPIYGPEGLLFIFGGYQGADAASFEWALMYVR